MVYIKPKSTFGCTTSNLILIAYSSRLLPPRATSSFNSKVHHQSTKLIIEYSQTLHCSESISAPTGRWYYLCLMHHYLIHKCNAIHHSPHLKVCYMQHVHTQPCTRSSCWNQHDKHPQPQSDNRYHYHSCKPHIPPPESTQTP